MKKDKHIAFCVDNAYAEYLSVTIKSIIYNNSRHNITFHIISDYISKKQACRLKELVYGLEKFDLLFHFIDDTSLKGLKIMREWPIQAWYRLLLPDVLGKEISKILYLDADTLVEADLNELFDWDLSGKSIAAVVAPSNFNPKHYKRLGYDCKKQYICSGVILMNLDYWRAHNLTTKIVSWANENMDKLVFPDQDAINVVCQDTKILLPLKYGFVQGFLYEERFFDFPFFTQLKDAVYNPAVIHYAFCAPWYRDTQRHIMHDKWQKYNEMLEYPIKCRYKAKGLLKIKQIIWNILNPAPRPFFSINEIQKRIYGKLVCF